VVFIAVVLSILTPGAKLLATVSEWFIPPPNCLDKPTEVDPCEFVRTADQGPRESIACFDKDLVLIELKMIMEERYAEAVYATVFFENASHCVETSVISRCDFLNIIDIKEFVEL
jgi:hypothetical protein